MDAKARHAVRVPLMMLLLAAVGSAAPAAVEGRAAPRPEGAADPVAAAGAGERAEPSLSIVRYDLDVTADFERAALSVGARVRLENRSGDTLTTLRIVLWNQGEAGGGTVALGRCLATQAEGTADLAGLAGRTGAWPADSPLEVTLPWPLPPGAAAELDLAYEIANQAGVESPPFFGATAEERELYLLSDFDWLPRLAREAPPGQFPPPDLPAWTLRLDRPAGTRAVTEGALEGRREHDGRTVETWRSWSGGSPQLVAGRFDVVETRGGSISAEVCFPSSAASPELATAARRVGERLVAILDLYRRSFGEPGFPVYRFVATRAGWGAHGLLMGQVVDEQFLRHVDLESIAHEASHTWWGCLVVSWGEGSKFLRESLAGFSAALAMGELEGPEAYRQALLRLKAKAFCYYPAATDANARAPLLALPGVRPGAVTGACYNRGPVVLAEMRRELGDAVFFRALRSFAPGSRGRSATIGEFERAFSGATGRDLRPYLDGLLRAADWPAYVLGAWRCAEEGGVWVTTVELRNEGGVAAACPVLLRSASGDRTVEASAAPGATAEVTVATPGAVTGVVLDPDGTALTYRPSERRRLWLALDEERLGTENWLWFNKAAMSMASGDAAAAVRLLSRYVDIHVRTRRLASVADAGREPLVACYLLVRAAAYRREADGEAAAADVRAAVPGLLAVLAEPRLEVMAINSGLASRASADRDLWALLAGLLGRPSPVAAGELTDASRAEVVSAWQTWWATEGATAPIRLDPLSAIGAGW